MEKLSILTWGLTSEEILRVRTILAQYTRLPIDFVEHEEVQKVILRTAIKSIEIESEAKVIFMKPVEDYLSAIVWISKSIDAIIVCENHEEPSKVLAIAVGGRAFPNDMIEFARVHHEKTED